MSIEIGKIVAEENTAKSGAIERCFEFNKPNVFLSPEDINPSSRLCNESSLIDAYVVFKTETDKWGRNWAIDVCAIDEVSEDFLLQNVLTKEMLKDSNIHNILLRACPSLIFENDSYKYLKNFNFSAVRRAFFKKCNEGIFTICGALFNFFKVSHVSYVYFWIKDNWTVFTDFSKEDVKELRSLCLRLYQINTQDNEIQKFISRIYLCNSTVWKDKDFLDSLPAKALKEFTESFEAQKADESSKRFFEEYISEKAKSDNDIYKLLCKKSPALIFHNDPMLYLANFNYPAVQSVFCKGIKDGKFSLCNSLIQYFSSSIGNFNWTPAYWSVFDFSNEDVKELRDICKKASAKGINVNYIYKQNSNIWKDKEFLQSLSTMELANLIRAINAQELEKVSEEFLRENLPEGASSDGVISAELIQLYPALVLGDNPVKYLENFDIPAVETLFFKGYAEGKYSICSALMEYIKSGSDNSSRHGITWGKLGDFKKENDEELRALCLEACGKKYDVRYLFKIGLKFWKDKDFLCKLPLINFMELLNEIDSSSEEDMRAHIPESKLGDMSVREVLLDKFPSLVLSENIVEYFENFKRLAVRELFFKKYKEEKFHICRPLIEYINSPKYYSYWSSQYLDMLSFVNEDVEELREFCRVAFDKKINIHFLLQSHRNIWKSKDFLTDMPQEEVSWLVGYLTSYQSQLNQDEFKFLMSNCNSLEIKKRLCEHVDFQWIVDNPEYMQYAPKDWISRYIARAGKQAFDSLISSTNDKVILKYICNSVDIDWVIPYPGLIQYLDKNKQLLLVEKIKIDDKDTGAKNLASLILSGLKDCKYPQVLKSLAEKYEKAGVTEESDWWNMLSEKQKKETLACYKKEGRITASNATSNKLLDEYLEKYFTGKDVPSENKRDFNIQQREAIQSVNGITMLYAVPGSGKTTVIVARAGYMAYGLPEKERITTNHLIMTFSKDAAEEMEERYNAIFSQNLEKDDKTKVKNGPKFCTIHAFCRDVVFSLKRKGVTFPILLNNQEDKKDPQKNRKREIMYAFCRKAYPKIKLGEAVKKFNEAYRKDSNERDSQEQMIVDTFKIEYEKINVTQKNLLREILISQLEEELRNETRYNMPTDEIINIAIDTVVSLIRYIKNRVLPTTVSGTVNSSDLKKITFKLGKEDFPIEYIYYKYNSELETRNLMDFDDMVRKAYEGFLKYDDVLKDYQDKFQYVSLDEAQDTSSLQYAVVELLTKKNGNLFMVGDDDQSIYAFRGANPEEMLEYKKRIPKVRKYKKLKLDTNYRSDRDIVNSAKGFIKTNTKRERKEMNTNSKNDGIINIVSIKNLADQYEYVVKAVQNCSQNQHTKENALAILARRNISFFPLMSYFYRYSKDNILNILYSFSRPKETIESVLHRLNTQKIVNVLKYLINRDNFTSFDKVRCDCYRYSIYNNDIEGIRKKWQEQQEEEKQGRLIEDAVEAYFTEQKKEDRLERFKEQRARVESLLQMNLCDAIAYIINEPDFQIKKEEGKDNIVSWMRIYALISSAMAFSDLEKKEQIAEFLKMIDAMLKSPNKWQQHNPRIRLSTIHGAKGSEYDRVIIIDAIDELMPGSEKGNDIWFDPEEERRLFYVAATRAKHELDILQVDVYYDRPRVPSRFIKEFLVAGKHINIISFDSRKYGGIKNVKTPHYVICSGKNAGIYLDKNKVENIKKADPSISVINCESYDEACVLIHKSYEDIEYDKLCELVDEAKELPEGLSDKIWKRFNKNGKSGLNHNDIIRIRNNANLFLETGVTNYQECTNEYTLKYLPLNIYKIWTPLNEMLQAARLPLRDTIKILELGAGPGTATLGLIEFYKKLAEENPDKKFVIEYNVIEYERAFIDIFQYLVEPFTKDNLTVKINEIIQGDAFEKIKQFAGKEMDLIMESNMINPNEHINQSKFSEFTQDICNALRYYGDFLLIEPAKSEVKAYFNQIFIEANRNGSPLCASNSCDYAEVDLSKMEIINDIKKMGIRTDDIDSHSFCYAVFEKMNMEEMANDSQC